MTLTTLDYSFIIGFFTISILIGVWVSRKSGENSTEFFLSGRNMPWWLLGMSMVATTFSTDTPNLVTDIVRQNGVSGNWVWWAFLITGMLTVFVYARLWRKSGVATDIEFYELRYGGKPARFLRAFRAIYLGLIFNVLSMSAVSLAAIKIGEVMLGLSPIATIGIAALVTVIFSTLGGFRGVIYTDFLLFFVAMIGAISAAVVAVNHPDVGGLSNLLANEAIQSKISILPDFNDTETLIGVLIIPLAVQWWSSWYPGAEPGGGGYIAQRMLAAKDENHAIGATFFFNILHYALRPWPWILVALASMVVFPDLDSIKAAFPNISEGKLGHDLAYPAMLTFLPAGLLGLVLASLIAAYMSTISTHLNWGSSYIINDVYKRFVKPEATEKELVRMGRISTVVMMILGAALALYLTNAVQIFNIIIMFGAGTGLIFILRWFWWRINAWSEIAAMIISGIVSIAFEFGGMYPASMPGWAKFPTVVLITTIVWLATTFLTSPESKATLRSFYKHIQPGGPGWQKVVSEAEADGEEIVTHTGKWTVPSGIMAMLAGIMLVYSTLFATGYWLYGKTTTAIILTVVAIGAALLLRNLWLKIGKSIL
jgi:Na+/proline symporter